MNELFDVRDSSVADQNEQLKKQASELSKLEYDIAEQRESYESLLKSHEMLNAQIANEQKQWDRDLAGYEELKRQSTYQDEIRKEHQQKLTEQLKVKQEPLSLTDIKYVDNSLSPVSKRR